MTKDWIPTASGQFAMPLDVFVDLGAKITELTLPHLALSVPTYYIVAPAECSSNLSRYDGIRFGYRHPDASDIGELYTRSRQEGFGAEVKRRIMTGTYAAVRWLLRCILSAGAESSAFDQ